MQKIQVVNIKCGGCVKTITTELQKLGIKDISINIASQTISFDGEREKVLRGLSELGYPEATTDEAKSFFKKARSFVSCAIGKVK